MECKKYVYLHIISQKNFNYEKNYHIFAALRGSSRLFAVLVVILFVFACKKDVQSIKDIPISENQMNMVSEREITPVTKSWLINYQADLKQVLLDQNISTVYTPSQMVAGAEALINISANTVGSRLIYKMKTNSFQVNLSNDEYALKYIYSQSYQIYRNHYLLFDTTKARPVLIDIKLDSVKNNIGYVSTKTIIGLIDVCAVQHKTVLANEPCATAFSDDEGYRVGGGDEELELASSWDNPMCNNSCGSAEPCQAGPTTAYEAVEERINFNYATNNPPTPPSGYYFTGTYTNVICDNFVDFSFAVETCGLTNQTIGTCLQADPSDPNIDPLNCLYCTIYSKLEDNESPFLIPPGCHFVSLNLGIWYCGCGEDVFCDYLANKVVGNICYGKPVFKKKFPGVWENPIDVLIPDMSMD